MKYFGTTKELELLQFQERLPLLVAIVSMAVLIPLSLGLKMEKEHLQLTRIILVVRK